tara:strand:- start:297 stop:791 length:495 start_codon:yes stop_codon:yes gene_type:complete
MGKYMSNAVIQKLLLVALGGLIVTIFFSVSCSTTNQAEEGELDSTMKEELLALANNRDAWFLASDITSEALEGLYGSWSIICRNETSLADYKGTVYEVVRPLVLGMLKMELKDAQKAKRFYKVERWSSPWAYVEQTWKLGDKIVLGPEYQLYLIESGAWRYHDC